MTETIVGDYSLSLRNYLAIEILKIAMAHMNIQVLMSHGDPSKPNAQVVLSERCYALADAMLAASVK